MERINYASPSLYEGKVGYSRAVKKGPFIAVAGTTASDPETGKLLYPGDAYNQAKQVFINIEKALNALGSSHKDVIRTRMFVKDIERDWEAIGKAHFETYGTIMPAATMVQVPLINPDMLIEVEVDAVVG
ncbi:hypothetical protein HDU76_013495 [Blyttiomyces sp. JEL0837]|nr:hypothetical protein HDU76_013495 [Blyttiomyces sp. JEL0837]